MAKESEYVQHVNFFLSHKHSLKSSDLQKVNSASIKYTKCMLGALCLSLALQIPFKRLEHRNTAPYTISALVIKLALGHFYGFNTNLKPVFKEVYLHHSTAD